MDLRKKHGDDYYKNIRSKRTTYGTGGFKPGDERAKEAGKKGAQARWSKEFKEMIKPIEQFAPKDE